MSRKHEMLNLGMPNEVSYATGRAVQVRDEFGLSLDPKDNADPKCLNCSGRGMVRRVILGEEGRAAAPCGCVTRVYQRKRREAEVVVDEIRKAERTAAEAGCAVVRSGGLRHTQIVLSSEKDGGS